MLNRLKRQFWQWRGVLIAVPSVTAIVLLLRFVGLLELLEMAAYDQILRLRPQEPIDSRIVIVKIDESDIKNLDLPISDGVYARVIENLKKYQPSAIGLDIYRDKPTGQGHAALVKVFESTPNLIGVQKVGESYDSSSVPPSPVLKKLDQVGANDFPIDRDGKIRRTLISVKDHEGNGLFSFSWRLAYLYLKDKNVKFDLTKDGLIQINSTILPRFQANDGGYVRADDGGYQLLINYRGRMQSFLTLSITDVLENRIPPDLIRGHIVLIGSTAESLKDLLYTPYTGSLRRAAERMPGVAIHANSISQILSVALNNRPLIETWDEPLEWLWIFGWAMLAASITWQQRYNRNAKRRVSWTLPGISLSVIALVIVSYLALLGGWWIPIVPALLAVTGSAIAVTAYVARSAGEIRKAFGRFVTDEIVANLLENPEGLKLGGERRKITILTSDIRGFTAISERLPPEEVIRIINLYLGYMADVITQYQGTIDEFMGDGILVLFGAPTAREDDADRAIACAIAMQLAMHPVNEKMTSLGLPRLEMGIGINTGEVVVGNIGSEKRTKYGIVGDQVNLTYRIESYTVGGQIFASESTIKELTTHVEIDEKREVQPKGVHEPIMIYEVVGISGKYDLHLTKSDEVFYQLSKPISIQYATLDGKQVDRTLIPGRLITLSDRCAEVQLDQPALYSIPAPLTNLKLNLVLSDEQSVSNEDVYAKVLEKPTQPHCFMVRFTNCPPIVETFLRNLYSSLANPEKATTQ